MVRPAVLAPIVCVLASGAAVMSFARGSWLGVIWLLLAGLTSNMAWYYARRARSAAPAPGVGGCADGRSCGACTRGACG
ncbi:MULTISPECIES: hypothetical protein [unclassified Streptomyces]|jgi:hypothetical protein|uniref:hypothetical protein n=1 Tax=unclassified Streptomyces TaxID=2593676 RepID=UPI001152477A|nr:hypothetical protein [Streptomyces sp. SLBN-31]TQJ85638.1 hypothetical protein FBY22_4431 [Streptomyces sp. SLBN-31]